MRKDEPFVTLKPTCIVCGSNCRDIRIQSFRGGNFGEGKVIPFVCCEKCFSKKDTIEKNILSQGLDKKSYPGGLEKRHIELKK